MNFQFVSDIHVEYPFYVDPLTYIDPCCDNIILAGDICSCNDFERFYNVIERICSLFKVVIFVPGNHEYYTYYTHKNSYDIEEINTLLESIKIPNFYLLNGGKIEFGDLCIVGCTLWSSISVDIPEYIVKIKGISKELYNYMNSRDIQFIRDSVKYCKLNKKRLIVVTHYPPILQSEKLKKNYKYRKLYYNELEYIIKEGGIDTWIFGHSHLNIERDIETDDGKITRLRCNQKGKLREPLLNYSRCRTCYESEQKNEKLFMDI